MRAASALRLCHLVLCTCALVATLDCEARPVDEMAARIGTKRLSAAAEGNHTCFVRADGNVLCWGNNASGQIGDGSSGNVRNVPTATPILGAVAVAVGRDHSCALLPSGALRCWGSNASGQLGVGASIASSTTPVAPNLTNVVSLTAGTSHTCARRSDGTVHCWGLNTFGQLGDGTTTTRFTPIAVSNIGDAVKVVAGATHTCALRGAGIMSCWGGNGRGQLGTGDTNNRRTPVDVSGMDEVNDIAAGLRFSCALRGGDVGLFSDDGGRVFCWGDNALGQLGSKQRSDALLPVLTELLDERGDNQPSISVAAGQTHACAATPRVGIKCWGGNDSGQIGNGTTSQSVFIPQSVSGSLQPLELAAGENHSCALLANDSVRCWGGNALGQLGNGSASASTVPTATLGLAGSIAARSLGAGTNHSCAVRAEGTAACWGRNDAGALGDGTLTDRLVPAAVAGFGERIMSLVGGNDHSCAAGESMLACWGDNRSGQVNPLDPLDFVLRPQRSLGDGSLAIAAGSFHGCAVNAFGNTSCRGSNSSGQLASSDVLDRFELSSTASNAVAVAAGGGHSCELRSNGRVVCWGLNTFGQLGDGTRQTTSERRLVQGIVNAISLSSSRDHNCALLATGRVVCWGRNDFGQVDGTTGGDRLIATVVPMLAVGDAVAVATGFQHSCILTPTGRVRCWGRNDDGQLGNNSTTNSLAPVEARRVQPSVAAGVVLTDVVGLVSDAAHNCALRVTGQPFCWGRNPEGQLGDNTRTRRSMAVGVGSFTANIAREAQLAANGRTASVTALVNCADGERFIAEITVTQGTVSGQRRVAGACTGGLTSYPLVVPAHGSERFASGAAIAHADIVVHSRGEVTDEQEWTRSIELVP